MMCLPLGPNRNSQNADNTLPDKPQLIMVPQSLLHLDMQLVVLPRNFLLPVSLGITNSNNNNSNSSSSSKRRADTMASNHNSLDTPMEVMANNLCTASSNQSPTLLTNSANSMSLVTRDSAFKPPTYLRPLLIR